MSGSVIETDKERHVIINVLLPNNHPSRIKWSGGHSVECCCLLRCYDDGASRGGGERLWGPSRVNDVRAL